MSNALIGLFMAVGIAGWVYSKVYRRTGGNTQNALIVAALVGLLTFLVTVTVFSLIP